MANRGLRPLTNEELVGRGLTFLAEGLQPFVSKNLKDRRVEYPNDVSGALNAIHFEWNSCFRNLLEPDVRSWILEARTTRNRWAHQKKFDARDVYRFADSARRILDAVGCEVAQIQEIEQEALDRLRPSRVNRPPSPQERTGAKGPVESAVREAFSEGDVLPTLSGSSTFSVGNINGRGITLLLGKGQHRTLIPWVALEGIPEFLGAHEPAAINGSGYSTDIVPTTLDGFLKGFVNRSTAGWVAVLLERAEVLSIDRTARASAVRLIRR